MFGIVATLAIANLAACGATIGDGSARPTPSSAPTPSPASRYVPITPLPPSGADVSGAQFVDATHGWALVNSPTLDGCCAAAAPQRLEWTADAGSAWVNITPPAARGATVIGVDFSTDADGWAVIAGDPNLPPLIAHTETRGVCGRPSAFHRGKPSTETTAAPQLPSVIPLTVGLSSMMARTRAPSLASGIERQTVGVPGRRCPFQRLAPSISRLPRRGGSSETGRPGVASSSRTTEATRGLRRPCLRRVVMQLTR